MIIKYTYSNITSILLPLHWPSFIMRGHPATPFDAALAICTLTTINFQGDRPLSDCGRLLPPSLFSPCTPPASSFSSSPQNIFSTSEEPLHRRPCPYNVLQNNLPNLDGRFGAWYLVQTTHKPHRCVVCKLSLLGTLPPTPSLPLQIVKKGQ